MDIATMANSLEARVPFLDHQFMEFVATIPSRLKLKGAVTKYILKKASKNSSQRPFLSGGKWVWSPSFKMVQKRIKGLCLRNSIDPRTLDRGYFRRDGIERLLNDHIAARYDHSSKIWALLFLEIWFRVFIDKAGESFLHEA